MRMDFKAPARVLACRKQKYKKNSVAHLSVNAYFAASNSGQQWTASIAQMEAEKRRGEKNIDAHCHNGTNILQIGPISHKY